MRLYRISFVAGLAVGFVAGTRAGRERYDQMVQMAKTTRENPTFQQAMGTIQSQATDLFSTAQHKVAEGVPQLAHAADGAEHGLLHDVVDVRVPVHRPADDVVDERQIRGRENVKRPPVTALRGDDGRDVRFELRGGLHHN